MIQTIINIGTIAHIRTNQIIGTENRALIETTKIQTNKIITEMTVTAEILIDEITGMIEVRIEIDLTLGIDKRGIKTTMKEKPGMTDIRIEVEITVKIGIIIMTM